MGAYEIQAGDYVRFERVVQDRGAPCVTYDDPERKTGPTAWTSKDKAIHVVGGAGYVVSVAKTVKKLPRVDGTMEKVRTARVDAGQLLGIVTAVLDEAVLIAKQQTMDVGDLFTTEATRGMYGTDAKGHQ